jgi:DNA-binding MarR family transcriptional regulator
MTAAAAPVTLGDDARPARVGYLIYRVERRIRERLDGALAACGVTTSEYVALSILRERDGLSNAQLARWTLVTPQAMSLVVSALDRRRLVRRRPDPNHRRTLRVSVTAHGRRVLSQCDCAMDAIESDMLAGLDPHTVEAVRAALASCAHALESAARAPRGL